MSAPKRIESWDEFHMRHAYLAAGRSRDPRTRIGAVLVRRGESDPISSGYNGFPRKCNDSIEMYLDRDIKRARVVHAEHNAILNAARKGISTVGTVLYTQAPVCRECAKACIQAGVSEIVCHKQFPSMSHGPWLESCREGARLLEEAGVATRLFDLRLGLKALVDGKDFDV